MSLSRHRKSGHKAFDAGLTIVELLVAMALSFIVIASIYYMYTFSTRTYRLQDQVMRAMDQARFAMEQLRRDIAMAGFMATPNSDADPNVCTPKPIPALKGIAFERCPGQTLADCVANPQSNVNIEPSAVTLFGAFWGGGTQYSAIPGTPSVTAWEPFVTESIVGNEVRLQVRHPDDFPTREQFMEMFNDRRYLRIVTAEQYELYYPIAHDGVDYDPPAQPVPIIRLTSAPPIASPPDYCGIQGFGVGLEVNPVGFIRYRLMADTREGAPPGKVDLVREELDIAGNPIDGSALVVAEFVADLQFYDFVYDSDSTRMAPTLAFIPFIEDALDTTKPYHFGTDASATPQRLRAVTVKITTRTEDEDPSWPFVPRQSETAPIDSYEVDPVMEGSARTVSLAARVVLRSFATRNVQ